MRALVLLLLSQACCVHSYHGHAEYGHEHWEVYPEHEHSHNHENHGHINGEGQVYRVHDGNGGALYIQQHEHNHQHVERGYYQANPRQLR